MTTDLDRYRAPGALARKRAAQVQPAGTVHRERMVAAYVHKHALLAEAKRLERAGKIRLPAHAAPVWSRERSQWELVIERLKPAPPRWIKPVIITGASLSTLSALGLAAAWLYATLAAAPALILLALVLVLFIAGSVAGQRRGSRGMVEVAVSVLVKVR